MSRASFLRGSEWGLVFSVICPQFLVFAVKLANILGCVSLGKSKSGFLYPKTDFAFLYLNPKMD